MVVGLVVTSEDEYGLLVVGTGQMPQLTVI